MGNYPYPSSYIVNGAAPPLPAFPVRAACAALADASLASDPPRLLAALADAVGVFYNHTADLECFSFKQGPNPETGGWAGGGRVCQRCALATAPPSAHVS